MNRVATNTPTKAFFLFLCSISPFAVKATDSIILDPTTGDYTITYCCDDSGSTAVAIFEPRTKVDPRIEPTLTLLQNGDISYRYTIAISGASKRPLATIIFDPVTSLSAVTRLDFARPGITNDQIAQLETTAVLSLATPLGWKGFVNNHGAGHYLRLGWLRNHPLEQQLGDFAPGSTQSGFGFSSRDLPDMALTQFQSKLAAIHGFPGEGPDPYSPVGTTLTNLEANDFVAVFTAVPAIGTSTTFSCAPLLTQIAGRVQAWSQQQLMDPVFNSTLVGLLNDASAKCAMNVSQAIVDLNSVLTDLRQQYPGFETDGSAAMSQPLAVHDPRLAARVLAFNVNYVLSHVSPTQTLP